MAVSAAKMIDFGATVDSEGHREFTVKHEVFTNDPYNAGADTGDGPQTALGASGIPAVGSSWNYGNDSDPWARCLPLRTVKPFGNKKGERVQFFHVESKFSTKPLNRCMADDRDDPLLEPQRVSGSSIAYTVEAIKDRFETPLLSSSHEPLRGPQVEFDAHRPQIVIEQNVGTLELALCTSLVDTVNDDTLWGLVARRVKLSDFTWEEKWYGTCVYYYTRTFVFDIKNKVGDLFDRVLRDEGTKALNGKLDKLTGQWTDLPIPGYSGSPNPDPSNPMHFKRFKDINGENARVILDGGGRPASVVLNMGTGTGSGTGTSTTDEAAQIEVEYYPEGDLTALQIPTGLEFGTGTGTPA
jgi:hypothetical protein